MRKFRTKIDTARLKARKHGKDKRTKGENLKKQKCKKANFKAKKQQKGLANGDLQF